MDRTSSWPNLSASCTNPRLVTSATSPGKPAPRAKVRQTRVRPSTRGKAVKMFRPPVPASGAGGRPPLATAAAATFAEAYEHLPEYWHREHEWLSLWHAACRPPAPAA